MPALFLSFESFAFTHVYFGFGLMRVSPHDCVHRQIFPSIAVSDQYLSVRCLAQMYWFVHVSRLVVQHNTVAIGQLLWNLPNSC